MISPVKGSIDTSSPTSTTTPSPMPESNDAVASPVSSVWPTKYSQE